MNKVKNISGILLLTLSNSLFSQEEDKTLGALITDRPDATESPSTIPVGYLQLETGAFYESFEEKNTKKETYTYNTTLVRVGLLENLELRIGWDFVENRISNTSNVSSGFNPLLFGAKIAIAEEKGVRPEIGLLTHLFLPFTAGNDYKPETTGANFIFAFAHTLSENSNLSYNLGAQWGGDSQEVGYIYSIAYGQSITEKIGLYGEVYGDLPEKNRANHLWDAGITYLVSNNVQLDATIGTSLTDGQDILLSGGVSFRIPTTKN